VVLVVLGVAVLVLVVLVGRAVAVVAFGFAAAVEVALILQDLMFLLGLAISMEIPAAARSGSSQLSAGQFRPETSSPRFVLLQSHTCYFGIRVCQ
jgi:hypothetical protein